MMEKVLVKYVGHSWGCHPETCSCKEWAVVSKDGKTVSTHHYQDEAERVASLINGD